MLQAIRNRAQGIFAWVILILIGVPFALWGIQNYFDTGKERPVAVVGDREIFERDVNRVYEQSLANLVGMGDFDEKQLKQEALNRLIREELINQSSDNEGFAVGDEDVRGFVQSLPYFQTDGKFDKEKYKLMLSSQGMGPEQFVEQIRRALRTEQYQRAITDSALVTKQQLEAFYRLRNQQRQIEYVTVPLKKFEGEISNQDNAAYYQEHVADFRNPEKISVQYLAIHLEDLANSIQPTEEELKALFEEQKAQYTTAERRKVSHILVTVETDNEEGNKAAQAKVSQLRERLLKGEDFAKLAKEVSDDKVSAEKGGDLGVLNKEAMEPNFANAAFSLARDEISQPIKTSFGYHLIKVTEIVPATSKPFEEVRQDLARNLRRSGAESKFYEMGQTLTEQTFEHPDSLDPAAKALNLQIGETSLFTRDTGEGIAAEEAVRKAAFSQDVLDGRNSEPVEIASEKVYVVRMKEHQPASDKPLAEVREEIVNRLRTKAAKAETKKQAEQLLAEVNRGQKLAEVAKASSLVLSKPPAIQRNTDSLPVPLVSAVFRTPAPTADKPSNGVVSLENGDQVIFTLLDVREGVAGNVDPKELDLARDYLVKNAGQNEFGAFMEQLREQADVHVLKSQD